MLRCTTYVYTAMPYLVPPVTPRDAFFPTPLFAAQKESSKVKGSFFRFARLSAHGRALFENVGKKHPLFHCFYLTI